jgi:hypothetical protein
MLAPGVGLGAPHFFMLQVFLNEKLILSHLGQVQSPSESPSGPTDENSHKEIAEKSKEKWNKTYVVMLEAKGERELQQFKYE